MKEQAKSRTNIRYQLLATVSAAALFASAYGISEAQAADSDSDRPTIWIEVGAQFERLEDQQQTFLPPFMNPQPSFVSFSPSDIEKPLLSSFGGEGKITFQPEDSDWVFSGAMRFGRSSGARHKRQEEVARTKDPLAAIFTSLSPYLTLSQTNLFGDVAGREDETHAIVDFSAGREVGIGMFGSNSRSVLSAGVRFAQFTAKSSANVSAVPTGFEFKYFTFFHVNFPKPSPQVFHATMHAERNFRGIGPSLSWDSSIDVLRNDEAAFSVDWGANAALLFGRQKAQVHLHTAHYKPGQYNNSRVTVYDNPANPSRTRSVTVPNLGGFAGVSLKFPNARLSVGYRADFFFGAIDGGIAMRKNETLGFMGPFASVSFGVGD